jgi:hypothetical protein
MPIIALLTDFGEYSIYVGIVKAVIAKICPEVDIIDLTHSVESQNIRQASFLLANSIEYYPKGTIFCCVVDPGVGSDRKALVVQTSKYYFVCPDNGILTYYIKKNPPLIAVNILNTKYILQERSGTFDGRDVFAPISAYIAKGENILNFGQSLDKNEIRKLNELIFIEKENGDIEAEIIWCDSFGNLITTIHKDYIKSRVYKVQIGDIIIDKISKTYSEVPENSFLAYFGSMGYLEIGIRNSNAKQYFGKNLPDRIKLLKL